VLPPFARLSSISTPYATFTPQRVPRGIQPVPDVKHPLVAFQSRAYKGEAVRGQGVAELALQV